MQTFTLNTGAVMPGLGLGTWKSPKTELYEAIRHAIKTGYRHIDCAAIYLNETSIGEAFTAAFAQGDVQREDLWVTSKLWNSYHVPEDVEPAVKATLADLKLDYLDLYLIHWPVAFQKDVGLSIPQTGDKFLSLDQVPLTATWQAMEALVEQGLVKNIGVSNFSQRHLQQVIDSATIVPAVNQVERHPYLAQMDLRAFCQEKQIHMTAYSPLGSRDRPEGMKAANEPSLLENPVITEIATQQGISAAQVLLAWHLAQNVSVIPKSTNPQRIEANLKAQQVMLPKAAIEAIDGLNYDYRYVNGLFWEMPGSPYVAGELWAAS